VPPLSVSDFSSSVLDNSGGNAFVFGTIISNGKNIIISNNPGGPTYFCPPTGSYNTSLDFLLGSGGGAVTLNNVTLAINLQTFFPTPPAICNYVLVADGTSNYEWAYDNSFDPTVAAKLSFM